ncbi:MAG: hypothetical protein H5U40_08010, partial [Polyangiaceae bacterium]|nr:hypothetical protein [Polyangiaceae bacterium]
MTFAAYGLIVHDRTTSARRAGNIYISMALVGEMMLMTGFILAVGTEINIAISEVPFAVAASERSELAVALLMLGFGVKAGAILLHMWLPLAHPAAPTPASAILSGAMIKAGLFGWLRFLPLGVVAMPKLGMILVLAGVAAAFYGIGIAVTQRDPKTILAYSSVSQMGFITTAVGTALASPTAAPAAITASLFYAVHHGFAKGALFLGTGVASATGSGWPGRLVAVGLLWPALDLAGAPLSSGALAKVSLTKVVEMAPWGAAELSSLLSIAPVGSAFVMVHFLRQTIPRPSARRRVPHAGLWIPWVLLLLTDLLLLLRPPVEPAELSLLVRQDKLWAAAWPVLAGILLAWIVSLLRRRGARVELDIPAGDLLCLVELSLKKLERLLLAVEERLVEPAFRQLSTRIDRLERLSTNVLRAADKAEASMSVFGTIGLLFLVLLLAMLLLG